MTQLPPFLAHLSQRLIGELIVYQCSSVRRCRRRRRCRRPPFSNVFSSKTAWPIKAKFYVEPPWDGGTKVYINGPGHMTNMAARPIYGKNLKNPLLQNQKSYDLETWHVASGTQALQIYINDDPGLTLTYFTARSNLVTCAFEWGKLLKSHLLEETCCKGLYKLNNTVNEKYLTPGGCLPLHLGYIHVHNHYFQTSSSLKLLGQSIPNFMWIPFVM